MTDQSRENTGKFSWPGFIAGLLVGAGLFYLTIQIVSALMFSTKAAQKLKGILKWVFLEEIS